MQTPSFRRLNADWNADPNAPYPEVREIGSRLELRFHLDSLTHNAKFGEVGCLAFENCSAWRLGYPNMDGWYFGHWRYKKLAPEWGEFYELVGEDALRMEADDWRKPTEAGAGDRHFLFYLRDETFECLAGGWKFDPNTGWA